MRCNVNLVDMCLCLEDKVEKGKKKSKSKTKWNCSIKTRNEGEMNDELSPWRKLLTTSNSMIKYLLTRARTRTRTNDSLNLDSWYCFYKWICHLRIAKKQTHTHSVMYQPIIVQLLRKLFEGKKLQTWNWNCSRHPSCAKINTVPAVFYWPIRLWMCVCVCVQPMEYFDVKKWCRRFLTTKNGELCGLA